MKDGQIKQVSFVNAPAVKYKKRGVVDSTLSFGKNKSFYKDVPSEPDLQFYEQCGRRVGNAVAERKNQLL